MNILKAIDQMSFGKAISVALVLAIIVAIPVGVVLFQQETRIGSRAAYEKPTIAEQKKSTPGPVPVVPPNVGRVYPWVGKGGDIVWIQGTNFGNNPITKKLNIGGINIAEEQIEVWENEQIQTIIPNQAKQGGIIEISVGDHSPTQSLPYVLYDKNTKTKLRKIGTILSVEAGNSITKAIVWTGDDEIATEKHESNIMLIDGKAKIFDTKGLPILSVILLDDQGKIVPYYVDPIEFDF